VSGYRQPPVWVEIACTLLRAGALLGAIVGVIEVAADEAGLGTAFLAGFVVLAAISSYLSRRYSGRIRYADFRRVSRAIRDDTPPAPDDYELAWQIVGFRALIRPWVWLIVIGFFVLAIVSALTISNDPNRNWRSLSAIMILLLLSLRRRSRAQHALDWAHQYLDVDPSRTRDSA
jgi:uncharacterized membrane protein YfcA